MRASMVEAPVSNATAASSVRTSTKNAVRSVPPCWGSTSRFFPIGGATPGLHPVIAAIKSASSIFVRIERIAQTLSQQVETEHREKNHQSRREHQAWRYGVKALAFEQHATPS